MSNNSGISIWGAVFLMLLGLKLTKTIALSWWWVFAPFWILPVFLVAGGALILFGTVVVIAIDEWMEK